MHFNSNSMNSCYLNNFNWKENFTVRKRFASCLRNNLPVESALYMFTLFHIHILCCGFHTGWKSSLKKLIFPNLSEICFCRIQQIKCARAESEHSAVVSTAQVSLAGKANAVSSQSELAFFSWEEISGRCSLQL